VKSRLLSSAAITAIAALGLHAPAQAQSRATPYSWSGFYVGLNAGHAWGNSNATTATDCSLSAQPPGYLCTSAIPAAADVALFTGAGTGSIDARGFTGGIQFGHNWQLDRLVYGFEADYGALRLSNSRQASSAYTNTGIQGTAAFGFASTASTDWLATVRGRLGVTLPSYNLLAYATGGVAWTRLTVTNSYSDSAIGYGAGTANDLKTGFAIGGGLEWACGAHWTVKGEYLYVDFGKVTAYGTFTSTAGGGGYSQGFSTSSDLTAHVARVGINYKF